MLLAFCGAMLTAGLDAQRLTVEQLHQMLAAQKAAHKSDGEMALKAGAVELTEQLTATGLDAMKRELNPGPKTRLTLDLLSDASGWLDPPARELPARDAPDAATREVMLRQAVEFAAITMHRMPNFLAARVTRSFDDRPLLVSSTGWTPAHTDLHQAGTFTQQITYRDGHEVSDQPAKEDESPSGLITTGEFGPVLALVLTDSLAGTMEWSHWEQAAGGTVAVFRFQVPEVASHYAVSFCSLLVPMTASYRHINDRATAKTDCYKGTPPYHGSVSIDPTTGAVMRIAIESDLPRSAPMERAGILVQYGTVKIGGRDYVCPLRSVAISLVRYPATVEAPSRTILRVNEATFGDYHRFGSTARIVANPKSQ
jgi:hypothetical protein